MSVVTEWYWSNSDPASSDITTPITIYHHHHHHHNNNTCIHHHFCIATYYIRRYRISSAIPSLPRRITHALVLFVGFLLWKSPEAVVLIRPYIARDLNQACEFRL